jgi:hypothetical protein
MGIDNVVGDGFGGSQVPVGPASAGAGPGGL